MKEQAFANRIIEDQSPATRRAGLLINQGGRIKIHAQFISPYGRKPGNPPSDRRAVILFLLRASPLLERITIEIRSIHRTLEIGRPKTPGFPGIGYVRRVDRKPGHMRNILAKFNFRAGTRQERE